MFPVSVFPNYLVFYRFEAESIRILYVTHGAQSNFAHAFDTYKKD